MLSQLTSLFHRHRLTSDAKEILVAIAEGATLKVHRTMDGSKEYRLHPLHGTARKIDANRVAVFCARGYIDSNMKFPAATFILTNRGRHVAATLAGKQHNSFGTRNYTHDDEYASW